MRKHLKADEQIYIVVFNVEQQYSIWSVDKQLPPGWIFDGKNGSKADCLAHIKNVWIDMRPLSLRVKQLESRLHSNVSPFDPLQPCA
jgi:MbtH protein